MVRKLKRGATYARKDGQVITYRVDGQAFIGDRKRIAPYTDGDGRPLPLEFSISAEEFARNPGIWEATPEEIEAAMKQRHEQEEKWHAARGIEIPDGIRKVLGSSPADKEMPAADETHKRRGRPPKVEAK